MTVPAAAELAQRLVAHEMVGAPSSATSADILEKACRRLRDELVAVLGTGGVAAMTGRALNLTQRDYPFLADVTVVLEPSSCFAGMTDALATQTSDKAAAAATAVLAHLIGLLMLLLGEDLGAQPVRKLWPHLAADAKEIGT